MKLIRQPEALALVRDHFSPLLFVARMDSPNHPGHAHGREHRGIAGAYRHTLRAVAEQSSGSRVDQRNRTRYRRATAGAAEAKAGRRLPRACGLSKPWGVSPRLGFLHSAKTLLPS